MDDAGVLATASVRCAKFLDQSRLSNRTSLLRVASIDYSRIAIGAGEKLYSSRKTKDESPAGCDVGIVCLR